MNFKAIPIAVITLSTALYAPLTHAQSGDTDIPFSGLWSGTMQVTHTPDAEDSLSLLGITFGATPGGSSAQSTSHDPATNTDLTTWQQPLSDSGPASYFAQTVTAGGAAITYSRSGQSVTFKNFALDTLNGTVYADIYSGEGSFNHQRWLVQGFDSGVVGHPGVKQSGDTRPDYAEGGYTGLVLDGDYFPGNQSGPTGTLGILTRGLGLTGASQNSFNGLKFANVTYSADYFSGFYWPWDPPYKTPPIPEPSTYALMAIGLACLDAAARRKRRTRRHIAT